MDLLSQQNITLEQVEERIKQLPLLPGVLFELMKSDPDSDHFFDDMVRLAKSDPPLAALIVGYANSPTYLGNQYVDGIDAALARVGSHTILQLLMTMSVSRVFVPNKDEERNIWRHSLEVAHISLFLAKTPYFTTVKPETAYMAGLLHDLGRFIMLMVAPNVLKNTDVRGWGSAEEFIEVEKETIGFTHAIVGLKACQKMQLPPLISNVVRYHHYHDAINHPKVQKELRDLLLIIQFSDALSFCLASTHNWFDLKHKDLCQIIKENTVFKEWGNVRIPIDDLVADLVLIYGEIERSCTMLGISK